MKQINFNCRPSTKKGKIGEEIVRRWLEEHGWIVYEPKTENRSHAFDKLAIKDKKQLILIEVKTKARRNYYPDTGIDIKHYNDYKLISEKYNLPIFLFFVDEMMGEIYGGKLSSLEKRVKISNNREYPLKQNGIIYFPLEKMHKIAILNTMKTFELKKLNTRNYEYLNTKKSEF
jgi:hypothetical protein